ncbi:MAG: hypothetical protein KDN18_23070 [Verrucomicrobiae bacterium]|nr:hypothetical protein [Verrucomicrobiae bacterium]
MALPFACLANGLAQREAVIDELLRPILTASAADPNVEAWNWEKNRNGGYLLRTTMDVTGDGQPEVFVASTLHSSRREHYWKIFDVADDGTMRPYEKGLNFSFAWPMIENNKVSLVYMAGANRDRMQAGEEKYLSVSRFVFTFPEISETTTYVSEEEAIKLQPTDPGQLPKLQAILLADYLTNPGAKWSDVTELKLDSSDTYYLEEDKERAEKNTAFTPQAALSQLGIGQPTPIHQAEVNQSEQAASPSIPQQSAATKAKEPPLTPNDETPSPTRRPFVAVVIVAVLGLLWVLLKKRK